MPELKTDVNDSTGTGAAEQGELTKSDFLLEKRGLVNEGIQHEELIENKEDLDAEIIEMEDISIMENNDEQKSNAENIKADAVLVENTVVNAVIETEEKEESTLRETELNDDKQDVTPELDVNESDNNKKAAEIQDVPGSKCVANDEKYEVEETDNNKKEDNYNEDIFKGPENNNMEEIRQDYKTTELSESAPSDAADSNTCGNTIFSDEMESQIEEISEITESHKNHQEQQEKVTERNHEGSVLSFEEFTLCGQTNDHISEEEEQVTENKQVDTKSIATENNVVQGNNVNEHKTIEQTTNMKIQDNQCAEVTNIIIQEENSLLASCEVVAVGKENPIVLLAGFKHEKDQKEESSHGQMEVFEHDQEKDITIKQHLQIEKEDKVDVQDEVKFEDLNKNCEETGGNILHHFCSEMQDNDIQGEEDNTEINNQVQDCSTDFNNTENTHDKKDPKEKTFIDNVVSQVQCSVSQVVDNKNTTIKIPEKKTAVDTSEVHDESTLVTNTLEITDNDSVIQNYQERQSNEIQENIESNTTVNEGSEEKNTLNSEIEKDHEKAIAPDLGAEVSEMSSNLINKKITEEHDEDICLTNDSIEEPVSLVNENKENKNAIEDVKSDECVESKIDADEETTAKPDQEREDNVCTGQNENENKEKCMEAAYSNEIDKMTDTIEEGINLTAAEDQKNKNDVSCHEESDKKDSHGKDSSDQDSTHDDIGDSSTGVTAEHQSSKRTDIQDQEDYINFAIETKAIPTDKIETLSCKKEEEEEEKCGEDKIINIQGETEVIGEIVEIDKDSTIKIEELSEYTEKQSKLSLSTEVESPNLSDLNSKEQNRKNEHPALLEQSEVTETIELETITVDFQSESKENEKKESQDGQTIDDFEVISCDLVNTSVNIELEIDQNDLIVEEALADKKDEDEADNKNKVTDGTAVDSSIIDSINKDTLKDTGALEKCEFNLDEKKINLHGEEHESKDQINKDKSTCNNNTTEEKQGIKADLTKIESSDAVQVSDFSIKETRGIDFEYKQEILEGTIVIESIIKHLMEILNELGKSIGSQQNIKLLKDELTKLQQESALLSSKANKEIIIQDKAILLNSEIQIIIQRVENSVLQTMKLKEEVDESISQEELMKLLSNCKKISSSINSHILIQDRTKTPPSSPMISDDKAVASASVTKNIICKEAEEELELESTDMPNLLSTVEIPSQCKRDIDSDFTHIEDLPDAPEHQIPAAQQEEHIKSDGDYQDKIVVCSNEQFGSVYQTQDEFSVVVCSSEKIETDSSPDVNLESVNVAKVSTSGIEETQEKFDLDIVNISDHIVEETQDDELKTSERSAGILSTIKGKISNVFSKSEESVQMEEKDAPESPETHSENIEEVKQETGFIATIKNRVGGFFYSHQDSKSDTSSSKYLTVYINLNCL